MARQKKETPAVDNMFAELENSAESEKVFDGKKPNPKTGPEGSNQPQLGGEAQNPKPLPRQTLSESGDNVSLADFGDEDDDSFNVVNFNPENIRFIPGRRKLSLLRQWCGEHLAGKFKVSRDGMTWIFDLKDDANKFVEAWNSRKLEEVESPMMEGLLNE